MISRRNLLALLAVFTLLATGNLTQAQDYPSKPIRLIVPYPPGGTTDLVARTVAEQLSARLKQPVIVDPRPGGNTLIGGNVVANAQPDGHTLLFIGGSSMTTVYNKTVPFDLWTALTPVAPLYQGAYFLMVGKSVPANNIRELVSYAKANPGKLNYGASGPGTMLATEAFKAAAGIDMVQVPYKGSSPLTLALIADEVQVAFDAIVTYRPHLQSGQFKIIGSGAGKRASDFPNAPTVAESGFPGFTTVFNGGVWAPGGTPRPIIERLNRELNAIAETPQFRERARQAGAEPIFGSPEDWGNIIRNEVGFWTKAAQAANYKPD